MSALFQRILMLVHCPFDLEECPPKWWCRALPCLIAVATLGVSCLSFRLPDNVLQASARRTETPGGSFRMARLVLDPASPEVRNRVSLFELPIRLPDRFDLTVDVWGDQSDLARTRIIGHFLKGPLALAGPPSVEEEDWHEVHLRRDSRGLQIEIDGRPIAIDPRAATTTWLSLEPPSDRPGHYRELRLTW